MFITLFNSIARSIMFINTRLRDRVGSDEFLLFYR